MYLDFLVKVPTVKGKITRRKKSNVVYIEYEYDRVYDPSRKYTFPKRVTIGKLSDTDPELMKPNQNFLKYFPDAELPESKNRTSRSSCLRVGTYFVLRKIIEECSLNDILGKYFGSRDMGLFLDLAVYLTIAENNAAQYYPDYTYNHPLFTEKMKQYSDSTVLDFLNSVTDDQSTGFLNTWNESRNYREKIYISYDSTNKNCQAGDIKMVEFGHPKVDMGEPVFNYAVAYVSEKLFRGDKSYLGNKSIRVYSEESARAKIFVEFVAMIVRCKMYIKLKEEMKKLDKKLNYMTVPAAIKELEKIEMVRQLDNIYRLDHAVTANQKVILKAFGLDANSIKYFASELSKELKEAE